MDVLITLLAYLAIFAFLVFYVILLCLFSCLHEYLSQKKEKEKERIEYEKYKSWACDYTYSKDTVVSSLGINDDKLNNINL